MQMEQQEVPNSSTTEAEEEPAKDTSAGVGGWLSGWYETAVEKSSQAFDSMKRDLSELRNVVHSESQSVLNSSVVSSSLSAVSSTATYFKDTVTALVDEGEEELDEELITSSSESKEGEDEKNKEKAVSDSSSGDQKQTEKKPKLTPEQSFEEEVKEMFKIPEQLALKAGEKISSAFKVFLDVLSPTSDGYDDDDVVILPGDQFIPRDRWDLLIRAIQSDPRTYSEEPEGSKEEYDAWRQSFSLEREESSMKRILETSPEVRNFHEQFVSSEEISNDLFWTRYFYRVHQLRDMESKRAILLKERQKEEETVEDKSPNESKVLTPTKNLKAPSSTPVNNISSSSSKGTSCESPAGESSRASSEEWEKTSMTECIVDEAAKKLAEKLTSIPVPAVETKSDEELGDWEIE